VFEIHLFYLFAVSILPGILWVWYFYRKDKYDPEPARLIIRDFFLGMIIVYPASLLESPFSHIFEKNVSLIILLISAILFIGIIEEGVKGFAIYKSHHLHPDFDEPIDGIIYGVTVGLGFAAFENLFYTILYGYKVGIIRAVLTSLAHASFSGIFGFYFAVSEINNSKSYLLRGLLIVSVLHGLYDFLIIANIISTFGTIIIIALLQLYLGFILHQMSEISPFK